MVVRMRVQMNTGIARMTSIFASVLTSFGSRRAARQDRLTNIGTGPSNLNHTDRRSQHKRVKNDGRTGDDWTTALAKRWQYAFIQLFTAYMRKIRWRTLLVPLQTLVQWNRAIEP
jgi:hypothetical protein